MGTAGEGTKFQRPGTLTDKQTKTVKTLTKWNCWDYLLLISLLSPLLLQFFFCFV